MTTLAELDALVDAHPEAFFGVTAAYEALLGGVPNIGGFIYLINSAVSTNYGSNNPGVEFNKENVFINITNALVQGNADAASAFSVVIDGETSLTGKIAAIYEWLVPASAKTPEGLAYLTRPEALAFYEQSAACRDVAGGDGAAIVALASILNVVHTEVVGLGDALLDLQAAIGDGTAVLPDSGTELTPIGVADGLNYDTSDPEPWEGVLTIGRSLGIEYDAASGINFA